MPAIKTSFDGNPHIGLFARATEEYVVLPSAAAQKFEDAAKKMCGQIVRASVSSSPYVGLYCIANSNGMVLAPFCSQRESEEFAKTNARITVLKGTKFSAIGNNIACNDKGAIVNEQMPRADVKKVEDALGVEAVGMKIFGYTTVGMMVAASNRGFVAHNRISEEELAQIESVLKVKGINGTVNSGTPMVGLGIVANSKTALVGEATTGFEMGRIEQGLELTD